MSKCATLQIVAHKSKPQYNYEALALGCGVSVRHVYRILNQGRTPSVAVLGRLSAAMALTMDELITTITEASISHRKRVKARGRAMLAKLVRNSKSKSK